MTEADTIKMEEIAHALWAIAEAARENPELDRLLRNVATPGGKSVRDLALRAGGISTRHPPPVAVRQGRPTRQRKRRLTFRFSPWITE